MSETNATAVPAGTEDCLLLTSKQVAAMLGGCSKMQLWRYMNSPSYKDLAFPAPINIGQRKFWRAREIRAWINAQAAKEPTKARRPGEPVEAA